MSLDTGEGQEMAGKGEAGAEDKGGGGRDRDERLGREGAEEKSQGVRGIGVKRWAELRTESGGRGREEQGGEGERPGRMRGVLTVRRREGKSRGGEEVGRGW